VSWLSYPNPRSIIYKEGRESSYQSTQTTTIPSALLHGTGFFCVGAGFRWLCVAVTSD